MTEQKVCPLCGDLLIPQGYCPVCEDYWNLAVGTACPKHDLPLEAHAPPPRDVELTGQPFKWVTVGVFSDSLAAEAPRIRLEAEGIPTFVEGERMGGRSMYHVATGGVKLRVPEHLAGDARIILSQTWSATAAELDLEDECVDDLDEFWEEPPAQPFKNGRWWIKEALIVQAAALILWLLYEIFKGMGGE